MEIFFIGVGEACDSAHGNTSALITADSGTKILLDCGFSVPHHYFQTFAEAPEPDYIWISHFHGDHFFGLPLFFLRLWQMKRTRPLPIVSQHGVAEKVSEALELAYPGFEKKLSFELRFHTVHPGDTASIGGLNWSTAVTEHSQYNLGLLLDDGGKRLYYSGDGRPTGQVEKLVQDCDLIIHEAFRLVDQFPYHGSISSCLKLADRAAVKKMALVHLDRDFRKHELDQINRLLKTRPGTLLPVAGDRLTI